jgi:hypothetical protein
LTGQGDSFNVYLLLPKAPKASVAQLVEQLIRNQ